MGVLIADNFSYQGRKPLDNRIIQNTINDMKNLPDATIYDGIIVYVKTENKFYVYNSNNTVDSNLGKWREFTTSSSGNFKINKYKQDTDYKTDEIIIYDNKIYLVLVDFRSDNTQTTLTDSFDLDLVNSKFTSLDEDTNCIEYAQNVEYKKDTLVYNNEILTRVVADYVSDNTAANTKDSFDLDIVNNKLVVVSSVKISDRIKSNATLTTSIGSTTVVSISDLPSTTINDIKLNQLTYDSDGTIGFVSNIDITNNEVTVITITKAGGNDKIIRYKSKITLDKEILKQTTIDFTDLDTLYTVADLKENQLIYDEEGTIAKIDNITTTLVGTTIDITTLTTSSKSFELVYYKYNKLLNKDIDTTQNILFSDLDIATTVTINDLKENQIIFDKEGTISKIENIDTINMEVTVRIITIDTVITPVKSYKTIETLNTTIGTQHLINVPAGTTVTDIEVEQLVYDDYGTLSKIINIDTTNNQLMVQTITGLGMPIAPNHKEAKIRNGGKNYQVNDIIEADNVPGVFIKVTKVDTNGTILEVSIDTTATSESTINGTDGEISYDQVIYGGYGNNWYQLSDAAVMVAQTIAESFEFLQGYEYTITSAGTGYAINDIIEIDTNVFVKVIEVDTLGEIKKVAYTREDTQNTTGSGATITYTPSDNVFIIPGDRWNIGTAMFTLINDKGATVQFLRTEQKLIKYSMGEDGLYKFTFDNVDGIIYQEASEIEAGKGTLVEEYKQNQKYTKDSLVYLGNKIGRVEKDFTSDNTEADIKESFKIDTGATGAILLISGEASDPTLTEDIKSNVEAGNIKINDLIKIGTTFTDFVKKLLIKEILPTGKITAFKSGLNLKGTTVTTPLITAEILTLGDATIDTIEFYRGTNLEDTQTYVTGTNIYTFNTTDISSNETVSIKIHYTHKDGITKDTLTYSVNYTFVNYSYFGLTNGIPTDTDIIGLSSNLKNTKAFTGTVNPVNQHIVYAYPEHLGSLTSIKDQNGFDYIAGSYTNVTMIINGENYKVYYLTNPTTNNGIKQIYS